MADHYCSICRKTTPHKSIMCRSQTQYSAWQELVSLFVNGTHYYEMECQQFCRICNQQNQISAMTMRKSPDKQTVSRPLA